jgi:hypothetical protein
VPNRDHHALRLAVLLTAALGTPGFSQAQVRPSPKFETWTRSEVAKAYANYRLSKEDELRIPSTFAVTADPFSTMLHKSLSRNVKDIESMQVFGTLTSSSVDPRDEIDLLRRCRVAVRGRLKELGLPFDIDHGQASNLGSFSLFPSNPAVTADGNDNGLISSDTAQAAASKAAGRRRNDQWKVSFGLTHRGIPLEKSSTVVILASGDNLKLDWRHLPRADQIPPDAELKANVSRDEALATGLDNFRQRIETPGDKPAVNPVKIESSTPSLNLWFPEEGVGKLAWSFSVTAETNDAPRISSGRYHIEAFKSVEQAKPKILAHSSAPAFRSRATQTTGMSDPLPSSRLR